eukprot:IDg10077t1
MCVTALPNGMSFEEGVLIDGKIFPLRINTLVADQKQERAFLCLKSVGSFMDCTFCLMPTRTIREEREIDDADIPPAIRHLSNDDIYDLQTSDFPVVGRNVPSTVSKQLTVSRASTAFETASEPPSAEEVTNAKKYLDRVSAICFPPALAAMYGLGTPPFQLYDAVGFDKLRMLHLGAQRELRTEDLPRSCGLQVSPFRAGPGEVHAHMTGTLRMRMTPYYWIALLGLQPNVQPDDDMVLQAALAMNRVQTLLRGVNKNSKAMFKSEVDILEIEHYAFRTGLYLSQSLGIPISTKLHRLMRHTGQHMRMFGCARRGDTDTNEVMHKTTKSAYAGTNHKANIIAKQLLTVRTASEADVDGMDVPTDNTNGTSFSSIFVSSILLDAELLPTRTQKPMQYTELTPNTANVEVQRHMRITLQEAIRCVSVEQAQPCAFELVDRVTRKKNLEHSEVIEVQCKAVMAGKMMDTVSKIAVIRRLRRIPPDPGNTRAVNEFNHLHYAYDLHSIPGEGIMIVLYTDPIKKRSVSHRAHRSFTVNAARSARRKFCRVKRLTVPPAEGSSSR